MPGPVERYLARDHARLGAFLARAVSDPRKIDDDAYAEFRRGLLRHIAMEERVLLPQARRLRGGRPLPVARQLRADHAALAALLVPSPTPEILRTIRRILDSHDRLEEGPDGAYAACEQLLGADAAALVARLEAVPDVPVAPHVDGPHVARHIEILLEARAALASDHDR